MSTTMRILGWKAEGLRCPDHEIDCCGDHGKPAKISLIQMPNGTGKTTTLTLLRAALSGSAAETVHGKGWSSDRVRELQKRGHIGGQGLFELWLAVNGKRVTIIIEFDFDLGRVQYKTTRDMGQEVGFKPPPGLNRFMDKTFVPYFVFDGELAQNLLNRKHTHAENAVESLFQLTVLQKMQTRLSRYWDQKTKGVTAHG